MTTSRLYASKKFMGALLLMMGFVLPANAQFLRTSYFMEGTHYRMQLNPAWHRLADILIFRQLVR